MLAEDLNGVETNDNRFVVTSRHIPRVAYNRARGKVISFQGGPRHAHRFRISSASTKLEGIPMLRADGPPGGEEGGGRGETGHTHTHPDSRDLTTSGDLRGEWSPGPPSGAWNLEIELLGGGQCDQCV